MYVRQKTSSQFMQLDARIHVKSFPFVLSTYFRTLVCSLLVYTVYSPKIGSLVYRLDCTFWLGAMLR